MALRIRQKENAQTANFVTSAVIFIGLACSIIFIINAAHLARSGLSLKKNLVAAASQGFLRIADAADALRENNLENAKLLFEQAQAAFQTVEAASWFTSPRLATFQFRDPMFEAGRSLINTGKSLAQAGRLFTETAGRLRGLPEVFFAGNERTGGGRPSLTEKLKEELPQLKESVHAVANANREIQKIPVSFVPASLKDRFGFAKNALAELTKMLSNLERNIPAFLALFGDAEPHTFLVLLQNNAELRPTGGFIGNYAILQTNDGYITKNEVFDVYSADHELKDVIAPPETLAFQNRMYFHDANYSMHFPLSAEKAAWLLEKTNGPGVDTVFAVDASFIGELLHLTGPVKIPELAAPLTAENFAMVTSFIVESKLSGRENPKAILQSFSPRLQKALFQKISPASLLPFFQTQISQKHLFAYSKNPAIQHFFEKHGMAGLVPQTAAKEDYFAISKTNIGGNKSDAYMEERIIHDTYLHTDGTVINEVTITRRHLWDDKKEAQLKKLIHSFGLGSVPRHVIGILGGWPNQSELHIYTPPGAELVESTDPAVTRHEDKEIGKTYFSAKMEVPVNESRNLRIRYTLPFRLKFNTADAYTLTLQKQAGQDRVTLMKRIFPDAQLQNYKYFPESGNFDLDSVWKFEGPLTQDMKFSSVWGK